jgi:hypothetical protein
MDPYLEAHDIWPDLHQSLAGIIRDRLNHTLPRPYYARLQMRPEIGIVGDEEEPHRIVPDVAILRHRRQEATLPPQKAALESAVAVLEPPRTMVSPSVRMRISDEPLRHYFVEIRDASRSHGLVTLIEIVSPANKRRGPDRRAYEEKQREVLGSDASLIEIDLLRTGTPIAGGPLLMDAVGALKPRPDYLVTVSRAWERGPMLNVELFPVMITDPLPCIPVPLREGEAEVPLDLQYCFRLAYDGGPYARGAVDYDAAPQPPLRPELTDWLAACLKPLRRSEK